MTLAARWRTAWAWYHNYVSALRRPAVQPVYRTTGWRSYALARLPAGWSWPALDQLWGRLEGNWNPYQWNLAGSGACGIPQFKPCRYFGDGAAQIIAGIAYIKARYHTSQNALAFRLANGWY